MLSTLRSLRERWSHWLEQADPVRPRLSGLSPGSIVPTKDELPCTICRWWVRIASSPQSSEASASCSRTSRSFLTLPWRKTWASASRSLKGRAHRRRVEELLELAGIGELAKRYPHEISGGQQQRVALARTLAPRPDVILLDEPFSNLDNTCTHRLMAETRELLRVGGVTAVVITHDPYEAFTLADRVAVLEAGNLEQFGTAEEIYAQPATHHVAEFSGSVSFLPVRHGGADTTWTCPLGPVPENVAVVPAQGGGHLAAARPHQLTVTCGPRSLGQGNAVILDVRFLGAVLAVRLNVTWETGLKEVLIHVKGPMKGLSAGSPARVDWVRRSAAAMQGERQLS